MTAAEALQLLDRRIADTAFKFGAEGYPTLTMREAREISEAWHTHLTPNTASTTTTTLERKE